MQLSPKGEPERSEVATEALALTKPHPSYPSKDKERDKGANLCLKKLCLYQ